MGRRPGPEVNKERCTSKPMNRLGRGTLTLQDGEEVSFSELIPYPLSGAFAAFLQLT